MTTLDSFFEHMFETKDDVSVAYSDEDIKFLSHFGVKGMKWGVRNAPDANSAKSLVVRGVAAGEYAVKVGYTSPTIKSFVASNDLKKINNSSQFKGKDIRNDKALQKEYRKAIESSLRSHERKRDRAWRYFDQTSEVLYFAGVATRVAHAENEAEPVEIVGLQLDENGFAIGLAEGAPMPEEFVQHFSMDEFLDSMQKNLDGDAKHFGVRGMKWGVRRTDAELARAAGGKQPASEDAIAAVTAAQKVNASGSLNVLSSKELQNLVNRMNLEKQYVTLTTSSSPTVTKGENFVKKFIKNEVGTFQQTGAPSKGVQLLAQLLDQKSKAVGYKGAGKRALRPNKK